MVLVLVRYEYNNKITSLYLHRFKMVVCSVKGCGNRTGPGVGRKISFFRLPMVTESSDARSNSDGRVKQLTSERRALWLQRINRSEIPAGARVCGDHFVAGQ